ncbi:hypothetical protein WMY93_020148 [Mugilogobius chulae]|uniref:Uncharacterized protein n=1 Tax=Mugilogobius chulae TaxID=88201 RepID=A0AAW0NG98_9GOBI
MPEFGASSPPAAASGSHHLYRYQPLQFTNPSIKRVIIDSQIARAATSGMLREGIGDALMDMFLEVRGNPEEIYADRGRTCKLHIERLGLSGNRTFLCRRLVAVSALLSINK